MLVRLGLTYHTPCVNAADSSTALVFTRQLKASSGLQMLSSPPRIHTILRQASNPVDEGRNMPKVPCTDSLPGHKWCSDEQNQDGQALPASYLH
eukprot:5248906-Amphidinium_carterae.1